MPTPYSDNLYAAADSSDDETEALSPTDGYFNASLPRTESSSHPLHHSIPVRSNVIVEDPTLASPAAKAREVEAERAQSNRAGPGVIYQSRHVLNSLPSHSHLRSAEEEHHPSSPSIGQVVSSHNNNRPSAGIQRSFLSHHHDAPPAYTPSPTSPISGYHTFGPSNSTMGLPPEQQRLIPRGPESMGDPFSSRPSRWQRVKDFVTDSASRRHVKTALGVLVIISLISILFTTFALGLNHKNPPPLGDNAPVKEPNMDRTDLTWSPMHGCRNTNLKHYKSSRSIEMRYNRSLSFSQTVQKDDLGGSGRSPHVSGEVILRPTDTASPATIDIEIIANIQDLDVEIFVDRKTQVFRVSTPRRVKWDSPNESPCIQIRVTIWAPRDSILNAFDVDTVHLDISVLEGFVIGVLNPTTLRTIVGDVKTPSAKKTDDEQETVVPYTLATREIFISTISGIIRGWYPLYDLLDLKSESGDVIVDVEPKPVNPKSVQPAVLRARSISGVLSVTEPIELEAKAARPDKKLPPRDYKVYLSTASGDITADVAVSSQAQLSSQSGDLTLKMWPVLDSDLLKNGGGPEAPELNTDTKSGHTEVDILEPLWTSLAATGQAIPPLSPDDPESDHEPYIYLTKEDKIPDSVVILDTPALSVLTSKHSSISGRIQLKYPSSWEGQLRATSISGSQKIRGEDLKIDRNSDRPWQRTVQGHKGTGHSQLTIESVSGDEDVLVGNEVGSNMVE